MNAPIAKERPARSEQGKEEMNFAIWNTLHDGVIQSVKGDVPGDVTITVSISYLCEKLPTTAEFLFLSLRRCTDLVFTPFEGKPLTSPMEIMALEPEVLSASEHGGIVSVDCVTGVLTLAYQDVQIKLAEGIPISQGQLEDAADRYWTEWEENAKKLRGSD